MENRYIDNLAALMRRDNMAAVFIAPSDEMIFLFGQSPSLCERFQGMFVKDNGELFYICNLLYKDEARAMFGDIAEIISWFDGDVFTKTVAKVLSEKKLIGKTIGVNASAGASNILQIKSEVDVNFISGVTILEEIRILKSSTELENLQHSAKITDDTYLELIDMIKPGLSERKIKIMMTEIYKNKGISNSYGIIASGHNTAYPHYSGDERIIQDKDIIILDIGCKYNNMCSDMTRTIFVGDITTREREIYEIVLEAITTAEDAVNEGAFIPDIDQVARNIIATAGYGDKFTTRLGHGIGYSIHEAPDIKQSNPLHLRKGMAFSIEPGIYLPGEFGVRIEDIVALTNKGKAILNRVSKEIKVINA